MGSQAWYLSILGIAPSAQGRGLGSRLLEPTLSEADQAGAVSASYVEWVTVAEYWVVKWKSG